MNQRRLIRHIHQGRSRRHRIPTKSFLNQVAHLSHAHLVNRDQETPITKIAVIQSSRSQVEACGQPEEELNETLLIRGMLLGTIILNKHKPIMENPVRDTKVTMVEVSQMRRLGRHSTQKMLTAWRQDTPPNMEEFSTLRLPRHPLHRQVEPLLLMHMTHLLRTRQRNLCLSENEVWLPSTTEIFN